MVKLTASGVKGIKHQLAAGLHTQKEIASAFGVSRSTISDIATERIWSQVPSPVKSSKPKTVPLTEESLLALLRRGPLSAEVIKTATQAKSKRQVEQMLRGMQEAGQLVYQFGEHWHLEKTPVATDLKHEWLSDDRGCYKFGFCGDNHLCSKYERRDVLDDLYDKFEANGVRRVYNAGNWIDGEARFNRHDLLVHGMDAQIDYLVQHYPQRSGITTYAVAGDDHEGWYGQREGVDIGKHAERKMRDAGRKDWVHLGYMEAFTSLVHAATGASSQLLTMHPGGGSAYAHSYRPQKIVESFAGGEKPAVLLIGHYHKISHNVIRNVWAIQTGCTQDQTPFMRKKGIDAHVGGGICRLQQDAKGAIVGCQVEFFTYYNRGYYNNRWSHGGGVQLPDRGVRRQSKG